MERCLMGYSPCGRRESDMTERLSTYSKFKLLQDFNFGGSLFFYEFLHLLLDKLGKLSTVIRSMQTHEIFTMFRLILLHINVVFSLL